ncbi:molybdate ABC transporter substrate-binding protein [Sneathiella limimaris]|uniref:molybdate ABC transporter substrate-binding protein n=1 Tax=Sneathiella limimaris TaxID=1964213 RepID=UPI00146E2DDD|nr:molybdate ABC transporter substrate-binding protein [Sneathiella limimaris]
MRVVLPLICLIFSFAVTAFSNEREGPLIFAAASLSAPLTEVGLLYERETGQKVRFSFAGSSTLAKQIAAGAEVGLYISANRKWVDYLIDQGSVAANRTTVLFSNSLVVIAPVDEEKDSHPKQLSDLANWLEGGRIAVGDPDHVPAGSYAKEAMISAGVWQVLRGRLLRQPNVKSALALVVRGEAVAGIVYETDVVGISDVKKLFSIDQTLHTPIRYVAAEIGQSLSGSVSEFYQFLKGDGAKKIFKDYGFIVF